MDLLWPALTGAGRESLGDARFWGRVQLHGDRARASFGVDSCLSSSPSSGSGQIFRVAQGRLLPWRLRSFQHVCHSCCPFTLEDVRAVIMRGWVTSGLERLESGARSRSHRDAYALKQLIQADVRVKSRVNGRGMAHCSSPVFLLGAVRARASF
jgi:hypothetical protein